MQFLDLYLNMHGSTNDSCMLCCLYNLAMQGNLMDAQYKVDGYIPYLIGDLG